MSSNIAITSYSATNVTTSSWVQVAFTNPDALVLTTPISCRGLMLSDTSTKLIKLGLGASGSQVPIAVFPVSGIIYLPFYLAPGASLWLRAIDATASSGYNVVSLVP